MSGARQDLEVSIDGKAVPRPLEAGERWIFGRHESCDVVLADSRVSRRQFEAHNLGGLLEIQSFPSKNTPRILGRRAHDDVYHTVPEVRVQVAETEIVFLRTS